MELKTIKLSEKGQISIPKEIREELKLKKGDKLVLMSKGKQLILQKADLILKKLDIGEESLHNMLASEETLRKDWDNKYDERWNNYKTMPSMEEMFRQADKIKGQRSYTTKELLDMIHARRGKIRFHL